MDIEKIKEDLSICYLKTISAINGIALDLISHDEDSIDAIIKKLVSVNEHKFNSQISVQLKCTSSPSQYSIDENFVTYVLKVKNYNDLCAPATMPSILAVLILPNDKNEWINWQREELITRGQMYWTCLQNKEPSTNNTSVTIKIPVTNVLNIETVENLILMVAEKGEL